VIADLQFQPLRALARAGMAPVPGQLSFSSTLAEALQPLLTDVEVDSVPASR
jgi:hypothetical protein